MLPRVPASVRGPFRTLKTSITTALLGLYFVLPWVRWDRGDRIPGQAVIVDIPSRRLFVFELEFWPQDLPLLLGLLIFSAVALFYVTTLFGRLWCGFACPQTVWTDLFFGIDRVINRWLGAESTRAALARTCAYGLIAMATALTFTGYFQDITALVPELLRGVAPVAAYAAVSVLTLTTYALAAHVRENVCLHMCPWPRFQSALLDPQSIIVTYQAWRGEPRARARVPLRADLETPFLGQVGEGRNEGRGDCIDCGRCVSVCPTRVDIRGGLQMGCIGCGLCVDACDRVMDRLERPRGLIHFGPEFTADRPQQRVTRARLLSAKPLMFALFMLISGGSIAWGVAAGRNVDIAVEPQRQPPFVRLSDGSIRNDYAFRFAFRGPPVTAVRIEVHGLEGARTVFAGQGERTEVLHIAQGQRSVSDKVLVTISRAAAPKGRVSAVLRVRDAATGQELAQIETYFWGPE